MIAVINDDCGDGECGTGVNKDHLHDVTLQRVMANILVMVMMMITMVLMVRVMLVGLMVTCSVVHDASLLRGGTGGENETLVSCN